MSSETGEPHPAHHPLHLAGEHFIDLAPRPAARTAIPSSGKKQSEERVEVDPKGEKFSGFIFKIQANMDPRHRDRIAFVRVVSGKFERDMSVHHSRSEKKVRLSSSHKIFGNERETVDEAYPGDIIGLVGHDGFGIGDTLTTAPDIRFDEIPRFTPEVFACLRSIEPGVGGELQLTDALNLLAREQGVYARVFRGGRYDTGNKLDYLKAVVDLAVEREDLGPRFGAYLADLVRRKGLR